MTNAVKSGKGPDFLVGARLLVLCCALLAPGCGQGPDHAVEAAQAAWSRGDATGVFEHATAPSAGMLRLLAFADPRFGVVPRPAGPAASPWVSEAPGGATTVVARLPGASGAVPIRLTREGRDWRIDLVATEAQARDDGGGGASP